ncbi:MAG: DUF3769 domain-containing protein [Coleofasciculus sp. G3-WIS-01]|uniref:DUF3769 domain-containing protein n=1 Tax=Coleofasciculus sp. G3-WIS-01 TaxID=3069528 RepID=UPI0032F79A98
MPQPVQPPETPAIIQSLTTEDAVVHLSSSPVSSVSTHLPQEIPKGLATPTSPETLAPEFSYDITSSQAALLRPPISVRYAPTQSQGAEVSGSTDVRKGLAGEDLPQHVTSLNEHAQFSPTSTTPAPSLTISQTPRINDQTKALTREQMAKGIAPDTLSPLVSATDQEQGFQSSTEETSVSLASKTTNGNPIDSSAVTLELSNVERIITQERGGEMREFEFTIPQPDTPSIPNPELVPVPDVHERQPRSLPSEPTPNPSSQTPESAAPGPITGVLELTADQQEYDQQRQVITAQGNVMLQFRGALLEADRVQVNLPNRILVAEDNVALTRGNQVLRGQRFEYSFVQDSGVIFDASGELYVPTSGTDLTILPSPADPNAPEEQRPISDRIISNQPLQGVTNPGFYSFFIGGGFGTTTTGNLSNVVSGAPQATGTINRFRYEADRIDFEGSEAIAQNVRITNDPFSPPELELQAQTARFRRISPLVDEIVATRPRLVFDQGLSVPTFRDRVIIDRREREPGLIQFGFDDDDRGGLFIERPFNIVNTPGVRFQVTPQYFLQRAVLGENNPNTPGKDNSGSLLDPSSFGLKARLDATFTPRTSLRASAVFTSLEPDEFEEELRASVRLQQVIGTGLPHNLNLEYSFRDRLFNGSLGFQTVQQSLGAVVTSPVIPLGDTGINLFYQAGIQAINADTDRPDLLPPPPRDNNRIDLTRYQASASLSRSFTLWRGEALPLTPTEGLRYTPTPVVPFLALQGVATGVASAYSSGDTQESLSGTIGLVGQLGHFSRPYLDYTRFNLSYTQVARGNLSPFPFDRVADRIVLSAGITQQIYGPFLAGFQTSYNLDTGEEISTDLFLEYSRRTYSILLRYNPVQELGSISLRINDFNWAGNPGLFDGSAIRPVVQGVTR